MCFKNTTCILSLFLSILLGVGAGVALFFGALPVIVGLPLLVFLTAASALVGFSFLLGMNRHSVCICRYGRCILIGSFFSIILSAISRVLTIVVANVGFAVLIALLVAAFFFTIFTCFAFLFCLIKENCCSCCE